mgnify:CR=1 FL=1
MQRLISCLILSLTPISAFAMSHGHTTHETTHHGKAHTTNDTRQEVVFPASVYEHTLKSMREHLEAVHAVIDAIGTGDFEGASEVAERGLGIGHQHGPDGLQSGHAYMPPGMRKLGHQMHMNARDLVVTLRNADVTGDTQKVLTSLKEVTAQCVACHKAYRLKKGD